VVYHIIPEKKKKKKKKKKNGTGCFVDGVR